MPALPFSKLATAPVGAFRIWRSSFLVAAFAALAVSMAACTGGAGLAIPIEPVKHSTDES